MPIGPGGFLARTKLVRQRAMTWARSNVDSLFSRCHAPRDGTVRFAGTWGLDNRFERHAIKPSVADAATVRGCRQLGLRYRSRVALRRMQPPPKSNNAVAPTRALGPFPREDWCCFQSWPTSANALGISPQRAQPQTASPANSRISLGDPTVVGTVGRLPPPGYGVVNWALWCDYLILLVCPVQRLPVTSWGF